MALNCTRVFFLLLLQNLLSLHSGAQTTLVQGDISVIGFNANPSPKNYSFVLWKPVETGTVIKFTDNGFYGPGLSTATNGYRNQEQTAVWTATGNLPAGTVVVINGNTASSGTVQSYNANGNTTTTILFGNTTGDQLFVFQGDTPPQGNNVTFGGRILFGLSYQAQGGDAGWLTSGVTGSSNSYLPTDLKDSNHVYFAGNVTGAQFRLPRNGMTIKEFRAAIADIANWEVAIGTGSGNFVTLTSSPFILGTLPLKLLSFSGSLRNGNGYLQWKTAKEENVRGYHIESSAEGDRFTQIGFIPARNKATGEEYYDFGFILPAGGSAYYRLKMEDTDGSSTYSQTIRIQVDKSGAAGFGLHPNQARTGTAYLTLRRLQPVQDNIRTEAVIIAVDGRVTTTVRIDNAGVAGTWKIPIHDLLPGKYILHLQAVNGQWRESLPFLIN